MAFFNNLQQRKLARGTSAIGLCTVALLATLMLAGSTAAATPPTVLLGTAGQFAVLAGSGITNAGVSTISGDVGSSPNRAETGFTACPGAANCVALTGANHNDPNPNDAVTQGAKAALTTAYDDAFGRTPTVVLTELAGQVLVGGVYKSASGTFGMNGTLTLDGENNADAVFIFQTASTLITGGTGNVSLIRGAQACNIFWQIGSAATLGAGSTLRGTVMAHDDISVFDGVTVDGRLLAGEQGSGAGAVTLIHDTITRPTTCVSQSSVDAAAAAAAQAQAAAVAQAAADKAAADKAIADKAAADKAIADKSGADKAAAAKAARAKAGRAKATRAKTAAVKAAKATRAAKAARATKVAAAKAMRAKATSTSIALKLSRIPKARRHAGFTG